MTYRINRYWIRNKGYWRVWRGEKLIARSAHGYTNDAVMEADLRVLFPHWLHRRG